MTSSHTDASAGFLQPDATRATVPQAARRRSAPPDRILRQIKAVDLWVAWRREREGVLRSGPKSRDERMDADRQIVVMRRTHDAIKGRCAIDLNSDLDPFNGDMTAVIAHSHAWFAEKLCAALDEYGVRVLTVTDNGAEALGAAVAEQPDVLLVGESLAMLRGAAVLAEAGVWSPTTLRVIHGIDQGLPEQQPPEADAVFPRQYPPDVVAEALVAMHLARDMGVVR